MTITWPAVSVHRHSVWQKKKWPLPHRHAQVGSGEQSAPRWASVKLSHIALGGAVLWFLIKQKVCPPTQVADVVPPAPPPPAHEKGVGLTAPVPPEPFPPVP